jgi:hypothetical protein
VRQTCSSDSSCIGIAYSPQQSVLYTSTSCTAGCGNTAWLNNRQLIVGTGGAKHYTCWVKADMGNWMGSFGIPNDTPVTTMWIPATHDTMALYGDLNTKVGQISDPFNYAKTQDLSLTEQLDAGIRALDIRVKYQACTAQELRIFHGEFYQKTNWIEVLQKLEDWITCHPTEFVLVFVKDEGGISTDGMDMHNCLTSLLDSSKWIRSDTTMFKNPRYGEFKGKLVYSHTRFSKLLNSKEPIRQDRGDITMSLPKGSGMPS